MTPQIEQVREKLEHLAPERLAEVEDFIDFLRERDQDRRLRRDYAQASEGAFAKVWDNDEDAIYDKQSLAEPWACTSIRSRSTRPVAPSRR